jgi:nucleoside 2-deoxyribosyltransferase
MMAENPKQSKIFFAGSIRGGDKYASNYKKILDYLKDYGEVISEHLEKKAVVTQAGPSSDPDIYARDVRWIRESDVLIAEVSQPSIGVGYEIAYAEALGKPVLALYSLDEEKTISAMISGNAHITTLEYECLGHLWTLLHAELSAICD